MLAGFVVEGLMYREFACDMTILTIDSEIDSR